MSWAPRCDGMGALLPDWVLLAGADVRDVRASDTEYPVTGAGDRYHRAADGCRRVMASRSGRRDPGW